MVDKKIYIRLLCILGIHTYQSIFSMTPSGGYSQTESYLRALAPTRAQAYEKIKEVLTAPDPHDFSQLITIDPQAFEPFINQAIETEKQHPNHYALYHSAQKEAILLTMLRTYITQQENGWTRDDFFILRRPEFFYKKSALTATDYIKQNSPDITIQYRLGPSVYPRSNGCIDWQREKCLQFDFSNPYRNHLISTSPAFVAGIDDTDNEIRRMNGLDYTAWESSFYYFATNLSWSSVRRLYPILVVDLRKYYPALFKDSIINATVRKYVAIKFAKVVDLLFPHAKQKLGSTEKIFAKAGIMFQFLIPKHLIDKVAYLSWANGIMWQRTINNIKDGWDDEMGTYTKLSSILEILQKNPHQLGRSLHLLQARIILKDTKYFYDATSPIKIRLIHSLPTSLFRVIEDSLKAIARVVVENNTAEKKGTQHVWFEQSNLSYEVEKHELALTDLLASTDIKKQIEGMNILYYFAQIGTAIPLAQKEAMKHKNSSNADLRTISNEILAGIHAL